MKKTNKLTKNFREGKLKNGWYIVEYEERLCFFYITDNVNSRFYTPSLYQKIERVLSKISSYNPEKKHKNKFLNFNRG